MIRQEDQRAIDDLFGRLRDVERNSGPRDAEAEALIREKLQANPSAAYFMAQTIIVQEAALRDQQARLVQLEEQGDRNRGGFLGGIFRGEEPRRQPEYPAPEARRGPWGRGDAGGGFLAGAAQTALGVTGGMLLGSAIAGMFGTPASAEEPPVDDAEEPSVEEGLDNDGDWGDGGDFDIGGEF